MRVYITPAGKTAVMVENFLDRPREEFGFDLAVFLSDNSYTNRLYEKFPKDNIIIIPISNPYFGLLDYVPTVRRIVRQTLLFCPDPEKIVINSSGGTEKMTNIIKDAGDILAVRYEVLRVFGVYDTVSKDVIFTEKPILDSAAELVTIGIELAEMRRIKEELHAVEHLDFNKRHGGEGL